MKRDTSSALKAIDATYRYGTNSRPSIRGKFLFVGDEKLYVRGVTYGTFATDERGVEQHDPTTVRRDFAMMSANGINALRTYTVPPLWLLDLALEYGLFVMVGLPWEQHITFLDDRKRTRSIEERVRRVVRDCAGHPALLCYTIGNEIPSGIVRWHGARRIERFLKRLYRAVKEEDPGALVTYVNYPSTEYLDISFADFFCFNVYLESQERLEAYLARLQNIAGDRPLVMAEIGLDSQRNGVKRQAEVLDWQVRTVFASGCAGAFVFAWTDEWHRGGSEINDWDFGLTTRDRQPKPALAAVARAFSEIPFSGGIHWPGVSVVVCSRNGSRTIRDTMEGLLKVEYPNYEVIVVDDGSTDETASIARQYPYQVISTENRGLSSARNTGMEAASGEIVAYIDDDAYPDPHWLQYLAHSYMTSDAVAMGGPNIPPPEQGPIADCVANAPGGPVHVLVADLEAEHIPGCNLSVKKSALMAIGGFDHQYRAAGDDVDVCWRLLDRGWKIGFSPAAMVWHHRRDSVNMYWKQQQGYGKAEALLEGKWPQKYNTAGHLAWSGRLYGKGLTETLGFKRGRIYHGTWGSAPFQSIYEPASSHLWSLPLMPEWNLIVLSLAALSILGLFWTPLLLALPLLALALGALLGQAVRSALLATFTTPATGTIDRLKLRGLTALLHILQPIARLRGRIRHGLTLWRRRGVDGVALPTVHDSTVWSETWRGQEQWLAQLERNLRATGGIALRGGDFDDWDLDLCGGMLGRARTRLVIEEHGGGRQLLRFRTRPRFSVLSTLITLTLAALSVEAALDGALVATPLLAASALALATLMLLETTAAISTMLEGIDDLASFQDEKSPAEPAEVVEDINVETDELEHEVDLFGEPISISSLLHFGSTGGMEIDFPESPSVSSRGISRESEPSAVERR